MDLKERLGGDPEWCPENLVRDPSPAGDRLDDRSPPSSAGSDEAHDTDEARVGFGGGSSERLDGGKPLRRGATERDEPLVVEARRAKDEPHRLRGVEDRRVARARPVQEERARRVEERPQSSIRDGARLDVDQLSRQAGAVVPQGRSPVNVPTEAELDLVSVGRFDRVDLDGIDGNACGKPPDPNERVEDELPLRLALTRPVENHE